MSGVGQSAFASMGFVFKRGVHCAYSLRQRIKAVKDHCQTQPNKLLRPVKVVCVDWAVQMLSGEIPTRKQSYSMSSGL